MMTMDDDDVDDDIIIVNSDEEWSGDHSFVEIKGHNNQINSPRYP